MNTENEVPEVSGVDGDSIPRRVTPQPNLKRRGRDILEVYPDKYTRLENGQIIKVKVDSVVSA
jgi:hypothetical protein